MVSQVTKGKVADIVVGRYCPNRRSKEFLEFQKLVMKTARLCSSVTALACTLDGSLVLSGHSNGQLILHNLSPGAPPPALVTLAK